MNIQDGRTIHIFNAGAQDIQRLADAIASRLATSLFNCDGRLFWLSEGQLTVVSRRLLQELVARFFINVRLASAGGSHFAEFVPLTIDGQNLIDVMDALVKLVAIGPSRPKALSEQQRGHIRDRVKMGEPREAVAEAYGVDLATVRAVMVAA